MQVVVVANGYLVNMPARAYDEFLAIYNDDEAKKAVLEGKLKLVNIAEHDCDSGKTVIYDFANV